MGAKKAVRSHVLFVLLFLWDLWIVTATDHWFAVEFLSYLCMYVYCNSLQLLIIHGWRKPQKLNTLKFNFNRFYNSELFQPFETTDSKLQRKLNEQKLVMRKFPELWYMHVYMCVCMYVYMYMYSVYIVWMHVHVCIVCVCMYM